MRHFCISLFGYGIFHLRYGIYVYSIQILVTEKLTAPPRCGGMTPFHKVLHSAPSSLESFYHAHLSLAFKRFPFSGSNAPIEHVSVLGAWVGQRE